MSKLDLLTEMPIIAIIRGVKPEEAVTVAETMYEAGVRVIEVPLNSPDPYQSIQLMSSSLKNKMLVGAGTVLTTDQVKEVKSAGGEFIVSPNMKPSVIEETKSEKMYSFPGIMTVSNAFDALEAGADGLKLFPANVLGPEFVKATKVVLPPNTKIFAVGGINDTNMQEWLAAGTDGFGLGSSIYKPGMDLPTIKSSCTRVVQNVKKLLTD